MGDFWGAGGAMSGLACVLAMQGVDVQATTSFGAASVLMGRVGGSLLPSELMTHQETETELQARMLTSVWQVARASSIAGIPQQGLTECSGSSSEKRRRFIPITR